MPLGGTGQKPKGAVVQQQVVSVGGACHLTAMQPTFPLSMCLHDSFFLTIKSTCDGSRQFDRIWNHVGDGLWPYLSVITLSELRREDTPTVGSTIPWLRSWTGQVEKGA